MFNAICNIEVINNQSFLKVSMFFMKQNNKHQNENTWKRNINSSVNIHLIENVLVQCGFPLSATFLTYQ